MKTVAALLVFLALAARADQISDAFDALKKAEAARDAAAVRQFSIETSRLTRAELATQPAPESRNEYQKDRYIYLSQTDTYTEYSMAVAAGWPGVAPATVISLTDAIVAQNPKSDYLELAVPAYLNALAADSPAKQLEGAARIVRLQPANEDALYTLADGTMRAQKYAEATDTAGELLRVMSTKPRPQRYSEDAWREKQTQLTGVANFYLGWANYELARASGDRARLDAALAFSKAAAAIPGPAQEAAAKNAAAIQQELSKK